MTTARKFDFQTLPARDKYKILIGSVVPRPIALVTTVDRQGRINAAPISFFNCLSSDPAILALGVENRSDASFKDTGLEHPANRCVHDQHRVNRNAGSDECLRGALRAGRGRVGRGRADCDPRRLHRRAAHRAIARPRSNVASTPHWKSARRARSFWARCCPLLSRPGSSTTGCMSILLGSMPWGAWAGTAIAAPIRCSICRR